MTCGIYKLVFEGTDKVYIGQSTLSIESRFSEHCCHFRNSNHSLKMNKAYKEFGLPSLHIIKECEGKDITDTLENYYIELYNSVDNGFNTLYRAEDVPKGTSIGELNGKTHHTDAQIIKLMQTFVSSSNISLKEAAALAGVKYSVAIDIARGKTYKWLKDINPIYYTQFLSKKPAEKYLKAVSPEGGTYTITNLTHFCNTHNLTISSMSSLLTGKAKTHKGWTALVPSEK